MIALSSEDLQLLRSGQPPHNPDLLKYLCIENDWLKLIKSYTLQELIAAGGSKLKVLHGASGTGKSHFLRSLAEAACEQGFYLCQINIAEAEFFLNDPVQLYKEVVRCFDSSRLQQNLRQLIIRALGYTEADIPADTPNIVDYLCQKEAASPLEATKTLRAAINTVINEIDVDFAFRKYLYILANALSFQDTQALEIASLWLKGEKLIYAQKTASSLYEVLARSNARIWLYSLIKLLLLSGYKGLVITIDQLEAILPLAESRLRYTPMRRNDVYELLRQLIDDMDFFPNTLILVAAGEEMMNNERHGFESYHALWMRLQPGFVWQDYLNPYSDLIDANLLLYEAIQSGELQRLAQKYRQLSHAYPEEFSATEVFPEIQYSDFRSALQNYLIPQPELPYV
ncbi:MAG: DUF2791 family P-loop domain-containing protein [Candidatus Cloacimonetes bacterium]|nr:DUF2791 family P-loop domain-containing protein [Candidatus Cloacimonadota bacterium]